MYLDLRDGMLIGAEKMIRERTVEMQKVIFDAQTLTPLFLAGADQTTAELRAPSFRGAMRYWLRTVVGGSKELNGVKQVEQAVFGATSQSSAVRIRLQQVTQKAQLFTGAGGGKGYLLWSMKESGNKEKSENEENYKPPRYYFTPEGTSFQLVLSASEVNIVALNQAIACFWLLTHLSGIGSRSRRCAGSLAVTHVRNNPTSLTFNEQSTALALKKHIEDNLQVVRELYNLPLHPHRAHTPFDTLAGGVSRIRILQGECPWYNEDAAMKAIGQALKEGRTQRITPTGRKQTIPKQERQIFGLPLQEVNEHDRLASPLHLRITKLQGGEYVGVAVLFKTQGKDYGLIDNFLNNRSHFRNAQEVTV